MAKAPEGPAAAAPAKMFEMPVDPSKLMAAFDPSSVLSEMTSALKNLKLPGVEVESVVAAQKANMEAVVKANRTIFEGTQAVVRRQVELLQESMGQASQSVREMGKSASPPDVVAHQAELAKHTFEKATSTMKELGDIITKANADAASIINARIGASLSELHDMLLKLRK